MRKGTKVYNPRIVNNKNEIVRVNPRTGKRHIAHPSFKEREIMKFLNANQVKYKREYPVKMKVGKSTFTLYYDFYLPEYKLLIEYDGKHHKEPIYGKERFENTKRHDLYKNIWAAKNKRNLLRLDCNSDIATEICKRIDKLDPI